MSSSAEVGVAVELEGIGVCYRPGSRPVLNDLSATIPTAATTAVVGPSGCGKSTLLYVAGLLLSVSHGRILLDGSDASTWADARRSRFRASHIGFVFQDAALDPTRTATENVMEALYHARFRGDEARQLAQASLDRFDVGGLADRMAKDLSGGEVQRVGLARALAKRPRLVLADEPTGNLDPSNAAVVFSALAEEAARGASVLIVTHDHDLAARCGQVIRLSDTA